jgi:hypothetical protein
MAENAATRRFCAQCGSPLPSACPACGFANEPAARTGAQLDWLLGYPDRAFAGIAEAIALGEQIAHPFGLDLGVIYAA